MANDAGAPGRALTQASIALRLERISHSPIILVLTLVCGVAWLIESFDIGVVGVVLVPLQKTLDLTAAQRGIFVSSSGLGIVIGCALAGRLSDRFGRKKLLLIGVLWFSIASLLQALSANFSTLIVLRVIAGLGMGAAFPIPYAIISEFASRKRRTLLAGTADALNSAGYFVAPLLGFLLVPKLPLDMSWRVMFAICGIGVFYTLLIQRLVPESPRWLYARGRVDEAATVLADLERRSGVLTLETPPVSIAESPRADAAPLDTHWSALFKGRLLGVTVVSVIAFASSNLFFFSVTSLMPHILVQRGYALAASFAFTAIIQSAPVPGKIINGWLGETIGRKWAVASFLLLSAVGIVLFGSLQNTTTVLTYGFIMMFFGGGVFGSMKTYWSERYPTALRGTGSGTVEAISRLIGSVVALSVIPSALKVYGVLPTFEGLAAFLVIGALGVLTGSETKGQYLEEIAGEVRVGSLETIV